MHFYEPEKKIKTKKQRTLPKKDESIVAESLDHFRNKEAAMLLLAARPFRVDIQRWELLMPWEMKQCITQPTFCDKLSTFFNFAEKWI